MTVHRKSGSTLQALTMTMTLPATVTEESITGVRALLSLDGTTVINELLSAENYSVSGTTLTANWHETTETTLAPGTYKVELWILASGGTLKAPSKKWSEVVVYASLDD